MAFLFPSSFFSLSSHSLHSLPLVPKILGQDSSSEALAEKIRTRERERERWWKEKQDRQSSFIPKCCCWNDHHSSEELLMKQESWNNKISFFIFVSHSLPLSLPLPYFLFLLLFMFKNTHIPKIIHKRFWIIREKKERERREIIMNGYTRTAVESIHFANRKLSVGTSLLWWWFPFL